MNTKFEGQFWSLEEPIFEYIFYFVSLYLDTNIMVVVLAMHACLCYGKIKLD